MDKVKIEGSLVMVPKKGNLIQKFAEFCDKRDYDTQALQDNNEDYFCFQMLSNTGTEINHEGIFEELLKYTNGEAKKYKNIEEEAVKTLLKGLGEDVTREGLLETPKRYVKFMNEFLNPEPFKFTTFKNEGGNEMIIVNNIPFFSLCEHHLAPFFGVGAIAYIPTYKIVGLSKLPRTLDLYARKLQNQERITMQVADRLMDELSPMGVAVILKARHLCVEMRGVKKHDTYTTTSCMRGVFKEDGKYRNEFLNLIK